MAHLEALYDRLLHPSDGRVPLAPKTVYEIHLVIRGALEDAVRRGLITRNVALVAHAPRLRSIPKVEQESWTAEELQAFLRAAAGHRQFPALWLCAFPGMRRNELLGLRWPDFDYTKATISVSRGLVAVPYELHEIRGKTPRSRRRIDLDPTTVNVLTAWRNWQQTEQAPASTAPAGIGGRRASSSVSVGRCRRVRSRQQFRTTRNAHASRRSGSARSHARQIRSQASWQASSA